MSDVKHVPGIDLETVEIRLRISQAALERLAGGAIPCTEAWLTLQPDGSYALGLVTAVAPAELGLQSRAVENDDRKQRFGGADLTLRCPVCGRRADVCFDHGEDWKQRTPGRPRPDFDPHLDYPERFKDGPI